MSNTVIQIKYSTATATPVSLNVAELAYSLQSNKLFIGDASNAVLTIGGKYYTDLIDAATDANTASAIVKRDSSGIFSATAVRASLYGNANTASAWQTARTIGVQGDANGTVLIDGTANANIPLTLGNSGVTAGTYGGATNVPTFVVDAKGRITSAANVSVATSLSISGDSGTDTVSLLTDTLTFEGGDGITSTVTNNKASFAVDNTVIRSSGNQSISGDLAVTGNLVISGNTITQDVETMKVEDSLIQLASNNSADAVDIGFFGQYNDGTQKYTAFFRDASDSGKFKLLTAGTTIPSAANSVDPTSYSTATLVANITGGTVSGLTSDIAVADGGTGAGSFTAGQILVGNGTSALQSLANTGTAGSYGSASYIPVITTDAYGRVSGVSNTQVSIDASRITSGTLSIVRGGTNISSPTANALFYVNSSGAYDMVPAVAGPSLFYFNSSNVPVSIAGTTANRILKTNGSSFSFAQVSLTTDVTGTLPVGNGGTGATTLGSGQILVGNGTGSIQALANTGTAGTYANAAFVPVITTDTYGRVSSIVNTAIAISTTQITSGTLGVARGGTGASSFTTKGVIISDASSSTGALSSLTSATEGHVLQINASGSPTFAHLSGGTF